MRLHLADRAQIVGKYSNVDVSSLDSRLPLRRQIDEQIRAYKLFHVFNGLPLAVTGKEIAQSRTANASHFPEAL